MLTNKLHPQNSWMWIDSFIIKYYDREQCAIHDLHEKKFETRLLWNSLCGMFKCLSDNHSWQFGDNLITWLLNKFKFESRCNSVIDVFIQLTRSTRELLLTVHRYLWQLYCCGLSNHNFQTTNFSKLRFRFRVNWDQHGYFYSMANQSTYITSKWVWRIILPRLRKQKSKNCSPNNYHPEARLLEYSQFRSSTTTVRLQVW